MRHKFRNSPAIAAFTELKPGRYPEKTVYELYFDVIDKLFEEWQIEKEMVDGLMVAPAGMALGSPDVYFHEALYDRLGIRPSFTETVNAGGATYGIMVQRATLAISAGLANAVLCLGCGKFPKVGGTNNAEMLARTVSQIDIEYPYGTFIPALYALSANRHMYDYGTTPEDFAQVAVSTREWAMKNPQAIMYDKGPLTVEKVLSSRFIAEPLHMFDCSLPAEGGGALLVTSDKIAKRITDQPAYILGMGEYHSHGFTSQSPNYSSTGAVVSGKKAFEMAGLTPKEIKVAEIYDAFSFNPLMYVEDLGFVPKGGGADFFNAGRTKPGGDLPINTYGGLLSYGHTGDSSGMSMIVEGAAQIMGKAEERQVPHADYALVHTYGGMMYEHSTLIFGREN